MKDSPIGLVGAGLLGSALAERMLAGGLRVVGYDTTADCCEQLAVAGGEVAAGAADVFRTCERVVLCLPNSQIVARVLEEVQEYTWPGQVVIDATTGDDADAERAAAGLAECGAGYVTATVVGSSEQARRGEVALIVGGIEADVARAEAVLTTWSERRFVVNSPAAAAQLKLIVNLVLGLNRAVLAEGLSLAAACGIDPRLALDIFEATPAASAVMQTKGPKMISRDFAPQARLAQHLKDVRLIQELAARHGARTPLSDVHEELLEAACELGCSELDNSAVIEAFKTK